MTDLLLRGGLVFGPEGDFSADVRVRGAKVVAVAPGLEREAGDTELDCRGCWVGPGFVDLHVHLREPGQEHKEDIASGSKAAAAGGFTAVVAMPNTVPAIDSGDLARYVERRGREVGLVDVFPAGTLSSGREGSRPADLDAMYRAGVRVFSDDGDTVADAEVLRSAMEYLAGVGAVVSQHAIDPALAPNGQAHTGPHADRMGLAGIPSEAEVAIVTRDLDLVRATGVRYHVQHVSAEGTLELLAAARREGLPVTAEVTPHHLAFDESVLASADPSFKMMPPLRSPADRAALRSGLRSGLIDAVATDHAPHADHEKSVGFAGAPFGVIGLASAAPVVNTVVGLEPRSFFERLSVTPARIAGIDSHGHWITPGAEANVVVFDPAAENSLPETHSKSSNSPFSGRQWRGRVVHTVLRGRVTHRAAGVTAR
jgi:dihydroorotase